MCTEVTIFPLFYDKFSLQISLWLLIVDIVHVTTVTSSQCIYFSHSMVSPYFTNRGSSLHGTTIELVT